MKLILFLVLIGLTIFTIYVGVGAGYLSFFPPFKNLATTQIFSDLTIASGIILLLLYRTRRALGHSCWPIVLCGVGMVISGSIAPLIYLLVEKNQNLNASISEASLVKKWTNDG